MYIKNNKRIRSKPYITMSNNIGTTLVFMFKKSTGCFPGSWNSNPGDKSAYSAEAMIKAAQSLIILLLLLVLGDLEFWLKRQTEKKGVERRRQGAKGRAYKKSSIIWLENPMDEGNEESCKVRRD